MRENLFLVVTGVIGPTAALFAGDAGAADGDGTNTITSIVVALVPWVLVILFIWFFVFKQLRGAQGHQERLIKHMERVEQQYDRIIQLLERLVDRQT
jgi:hypothetical protein